MTAEVKTKKSARNVCFTLNNYDEEDVERMEKWENPSYLIFGKEVGKNGTPHLQGYAEFKNSVKFVTLKNFMPAIHWESRRGTAKQAADYCKKDGLFFEKGEISKQGERNDLEEIKEKIDNGASSLEIAEEHFGQWCRNYKAFEIYRNLKKAQEPKILPKVIWLWGTTGTGKTRAATEWKNNDYYIKDESLWQNGYNFQEKIIFDDYRGGIQIGDMLRWTDRYKTQGQTKGNYTSINSKYIFITSEYSPSQIYERNAAMEQIVRRVDIVREIKEGEPIEEILLDLDKMLENY